MTLAELLSSSETIVSHSVIVAGKASERSTVLSASRQDAVLPFFNADFAIIIAMLFCDNACEKSIAEIMSSIDALKLRSSLTLFKFVTTDEDKQTLLNKMLEIFYGGQECGRTKSILGI
jgi:hypothetical protein